LCEFDRENSRKACVASDRVNHVPVPLTHRARRRIIRNRFGNFT